MLLFKAEFEFLEIGYLDLIVVDGFGHAFLLIFDHDELHLDGLLDVVLTESHYFFIFQDFLAVAES